VQRVLVVAAGGAIGTVLRYLTAVLANHWLGTEFPYGTLAVNLVGAFAIGLVQQIGTETLLVPEDLRLFLTVGVMGGLTTYSAFSYETVRLLGLGAWSRAWINVVVTMVGCLGLCVLGIVAGRALLGLRG
jgi:CrcB protein